MSLFALKAAIHFRVGHYGRTWLGQECAPHPCYGTSRLAGSSGYPGVPINFNLSPTFNHPDFMQFYPDQDWSNYWAPLFVPSHTHQALQRTV